MEGFSRLHELFRSFAFDGVLIYIYIYIGTMKGMESVSLRDPSFDD